MVIFSILYGVISFAFAYYGEMITCLGMTAPMAVFALVSWLRNPYKGNKSEVKINRLKSKEIIFMMILTVVITLIFFTFWRLFIRQTYYQARYLLQQAFLQLIWLLEGVHFMQSVMLQMIFMDLSTGQECRNAKKTLALSQWTIKG